MNETKSKLEATLKETTEKVPEPDEAIQWLRDTAMKYAGYVPGGKEYMNNTFDDIGAIQREHGNEVNAIVKEASDRLKDIGEEGVNLETVPKVWDVIEVCDSIFYV